MNKQTAEKLVGSLSRLFKAQVKLFLLEFALARYSLMPLLILGLLFIVAAGGVWLLLLCLAAYASYQLTASVLISLFIVFLLSVGTAGAIVILLNYYAKQLKFTKTRQLFHKMKRKQNHYEQNITVKETN